MKKTLVLAALLWFAACGQSNEGNDGGSDAWDGGLDDCRRDNSQKGDKSSEWKLTAGGQSASGWICPVGDIDHYWFETSQPRTIVSIHLSNNAQLSPVDLCYDLFREGQNTRLGGQCDSNGMDGVTDLKGSYYLEQAGVYFIEVRDQNGDEQDSRMMNNYLLAIETVSDPDPYEPNNSKTEAKAIGGQAGFVSYSGDKDWFSVPVGAANQIMKLQLKAQNRTAVDLRYEVLRPDGVTPVNSGQVTDGQKETADLQDTLALGEAGTYYIVVSDAYDDDTDTQVGYTLTVSVEQNPDVRDRGPNNDDWENATSLQSGVAVPDAYLATRADVDWYVITSPGTTDTSPALIEVELEVPSQSALVPAVDLVVADPRTSCTAGDECKFLSWSCGGCNNVDQCLDAQCPSHECDRATGKCTAAGMCLNGGSYWGCGIRSLVMQGPDFGVGGNAKHLKTVAPMYGERYYLMVRDYGARHYDAANPYRLTVTVRPEPDTNEFPPNGLYLPYITGTQEEETRDWNRSLAKTITCTDSGTEITCGPITGYISFRGDQDWYVLKLAGQNYTVPKENETDPATMGPNVDFNVLWDWSFSGSNMRLGYVVMRGAEEMGPELVSGSGTWGDEAGQCSYICGEYHAPVTLYLWVFTPDFKKYDYSNPYRVTIRAVRGVCPANCEYCLGCPYVCPNSRHPDPNCL